MKECHVEKHIPCDCKDFGKVRARKNADGKWACVECGKVQEYTPEVV